MNKLGTLLKGGLKLFGEAYENTKRQMLTSAVILIVITLPCLCGGLNAGRTQSLDL